MIEIDASFQADFAQLGLGSCAAVIKHFSRAAPEATTTVIVRPDVLIIPGRGTVAVFYKQYEYRRPAWKFLGRPSKARCEFHNYGVFAQLGIASARRIAWGEERTGLGRLRRAFIITEAIPAAETLVEFFQKRCPDRRKAGMRKVRAAIVRDLSIMTRRIHDAGFFHNDLVWRNILVTWSPPGEPQLWWIDCPRGKFVRWPPWQARRRLKDFASLDKSAAQFCRRGERLDFVKHYLGISRLDAAARRLVREALAYRQQRWPDDWK